MATRHWGARRLPAPNQCFIYSEQQSLLHLQRTYDESKLEKHELVVRWDDDTKSKRHLYMSDGENAEVHLRVFNEFLRLMDEWTLTDGGDEVFSLYSQLLRTPVKEAWNLEISSPGFNGEPRTRDLFLNAHHQLLVNKWTDNAYTNFKNYLSVVIKPRSMSALTLAARLQTLNIYSAFLPHTREVTIMDDADLTAFFFV